MAVVDCVRFLLQNLQSYTFVVGILVEFDKQTFWMGCKHTNSLKVVYYILCSYFINCVKTTSTFTYTLIYCMHKEKEKDTCPFPEIPPTFSGNLWAKVLILMMWDWYSDGEWLHGWHWRKMGSLHDSMIEKSGWWQLKHFLKFTPKIGEDEPNLTSIFFRWVETTN